ncbi:hypothetical protein [Erythrobacter sp.]|uniref:hypothetical protein n=1 Tax=Erythrobacter sp. TaxID=1042 RepID=UPI0025FDA389|nr:hypothetical protein [Erythrobacter sp.]
MRALVDIVENLTSSIRFVIGLLVLGGMVVGLMLTIGVSYAAPKAADSLAERAERVGEKAIEAAQQERRAREMGKDGWGYGAATTSSGGADKPSKSSADDGWAN